MYAEHELEDASSRRKFTARGKMCLSVCLCVCLSSRRPRVHSFIENPQCFLIALQNINQTITGVARAGVDGRRLQVIQSWFIR